MALMGPLLVAGTMVGILVPAGPASASPEASFLNDVSCTSSTSCVAVGNYDNGSANQVLIETLSGSTWSINTSASLDTSSSQDNELYSVSCTSSTSCVAVGYYYNGSVDQALIETLSGSTWSINTSASLDTSSSQPNFLHGVSCASSTCVAVGSYVSGTTLQTLVETFSGSTWSIVTPSVDTSSSQNNSLYGVSCYSSTSCEAVGYYNNGAVDQTLIETLAGSTWSIAASPDTSAVVNNYLSSVSCTYSTSCAAVGFYGSGQTATLIETLAGSTWTTAESPNTALTDSDHLGSVSCPSSTSCVAAGSYNNGSVDQTLIEGFSGSSLSSGTWSIDTSQDTSSSNYNDLSGVSCTSSTSCVAVGFYNNGSVNQTLIQTLSGSTWSITQSPNATITSPSTTDSAATYTSLNSSASDSATVTGVPGGAAPTGTVTFYICYNATASPTNCSGTTGSPTPVGSPVDLSSGTPSTSGGGAPTVTVYSSSDTVTQAGDYCFFATYSGDSNYDGSSDTSTTNECFTAVASTGSNGLSYSGVDPSNGAVTGNYEVKINGTGFTAGNNVVSGVIWGKDMSGNDLIIPLCTAGTTPQVGDCFVVASDSEIDLWAPATNDPPYTSLDASTCAGYNLTCSGEAPDTYFTVQVETQNGTVGGNGVMGFAYQGVTTNGPTLQISPSSGNELGGDEVDIFGGGFGTPSPTQLNGQVSGNVDEILWGNSSNGGQPFISQPCGSWPSTGCFNVVSDSEIQLLAPPISSTSATLGSPFNVTVLADSEASSVQFTYNVFGPLVGTLSADTLANSGPQQLNVPGTGEVTVDAGSLPSGSSLSFYQVDSSAAQTDLPPNESVFGGLGISLNGATNTSVTDPAVVQFQAPPGLLPTELGGGSSPSVRTGLLAARSSSGATFNGYPVQDVTFDVNPAFEGCPVPLSPNFGSMYIDPSTALVSGFAGLACDGVAAAPGSTIYQHPDTLGVVGSPGGGYINLANRGISTTTPITFFPDGSGGFKIVYGTAGQNLEVADPSSATIGALASSQPHLDSNANLFSGGPAGIIAVGSGSIIAVGSGSIIAVGSGSLISPSINGIIAVGSGSFRGTASSALASMDNTMPGGSSLVSPDGIGRGSQGSGIIAVGSGSIIGVGSGSIIAVGSGALRSRVVVKPTGKDPVPLASHVSFDVTYTLAMWQDPTFVLASGPPSAPLSLSAQPGPGSASVSWNQPALNGGSAVTSYTLTGHPHGVTGTASDVTTTLATSSLTSAPDGTFSATLPGLSPGTTYDVTAAATNAKGTGPSSTSASVVPLAPSSGAGTGLGGGISPSPGTSPAPPPPGTSSSDTTALGTTTVTPTGAGLTGGTGSGVSASVSVPAGALPTGTTVTEYAIDTSAFSPPPGSNFVVGFGVSWTGSPTTQTAANGQPIPVTMTIQDPSITAGQTIYVVGPSGSLVALSPGSYSIDPASHTLTISFTQDPAFLVTAPGSGTSPASQLGYRLVGADGGVFDFGPASFHGSASGYPIPAPIAGMAATPDGAGYWLVGRDGTVYPYGDARFLGQASGDHLAAPIVGMAATPDGAGYWLVGQDGGVFSFGDALFKGSAGAMHLAAPIVGMAATPDGAGYWLVGQDGGVFSFGDALFKGSTGGLHLRGPVVAVAGPAGFQSPRTKPNSLGGKLGHFLRLSGAWL